MIHQKICKICGKEFKTNHGKVMYCSPECRREGKRRCYRTGTGEKVESVGRHKKAAVAETKKPKISLWDMQKAAAEHGMSYGRYMVYLESVTN